MSLEAMVWALKKAPVNDQAALLVLIGLSDHAHDDGTAAYPTVATLAKYARCSPRTVQNRLRLLEESGVIRRGDQGLVAHRPANRRPVVYDLDLGMVLGVHDTHPKESAGVHGGDGRGAPPSDLGVHAVADKPSLNLPEPSLPTAVVPTAQTLVAEWVDHCGTRPPGRVIGQVAKELGIMLDEGVPYEAVRAGLVAWHGKRLHPSALASVVHETMTPKRGTADARVADAFDLAARLDAQAVAR